MSQHITNAKGRHPLSSKPASLSPQTKEEYQISKMERAIAMSTKANNKHEENNRKDATDDTTQAGESASDDQDASAREDGSNRGDEETGMKRAASEHGDKDDENEKPKAKKAKVAGGGDHSTDHKEPNKKIIAASKAAKYDKFREGYKIEFRWAENGHITREFAILNQPDTSKLSVTLIDTHNYTHKEVKWVHADYVDWSCEKCIYDLNKWYKQFVYRRLDRSDPTVIPKHRTTWTWTEELYVGLLVVDFIEDNRKEPKGSDWKNIADDQNKRFEGEIARTGEKLAEHLAETVLKKDHAIMKRTGGACRSHIAQWPTVKQMIADALKKIQPNSQEHVQDDPFGVDEDQDSEDEEDEVEVA